MPGAPVHSISFSASSAAPMAAATVSALMLSSVPFSSADSGLTTGMRPLSSSLLMHRGVHAIDVADEAVVDQSRRRRRFTGGALVRADQAGIDAADADGVDVHLAADARACAC